jgi:hypothetical protein
MKVFKVNWNFNSSATHSEHGELTYYDIGAKPAERFEFECLIWGIPIKEHTFKIEYKIK